MCSGSDSRRRSRKFTESSDESHGLRGQSYDGVELGGPTSTADSFGEDGDGDLSEVSEHSHSPFLSSDESSSSSEDYEEDVDVIMSSNSDRPKSLALDKARRSTRGGDDSDDEV